VKGEGMVGSVSLRAPGNAADGWSKRREALDNGGGGIPGRVRASERGIVSDESRERRVEDDGSFTNKERRVGRGG
jgi:hypothetical protein